MFKNLLVAMDGSLHAQAANDYGAYLATELGARLELLHVIDWQLLVGHFLTHFDEVFRSERINVIQTPIRAPQANAYAERFVRTVRAECLDWLLILGRRHLEHVLCCYVTHYNAERPHQGVGNVPLPEVDEEEPRILKFPTGEVRCHERLGGLLKHYPRTAAA